MNLTVPEARDLDLDPDQKETTVGSARRALTALTALTALAALLGTSSAWQAVEMYSKGFSSW